MEERKLSTIVGGVVRVGPDVGSVSLAPGTRSWIVLLCLCFVYVLNFLDRQLLSILAKPIQDTLHVSDGQLGLIGGLYFAVFYCFISIPVGWIADKTNRVRILSLACALWSAATMACGIATNFPQLVAARMAVGVGEAGGVPPSYSIISDYFPSGRRGTALGIFNLGPSIGAALGVAFGASIAAAYSWRDAFIVLGSVGLLAALAILLIVREPTRGGLDHSSLTGDNLTESSASGFGKTIAMFFSRPEFVLASLASGATQIITYGAGNFTTLFLMREKAMTLGQIAIFYALVQGIGMSAGIVVSGRLVDRFSRRSKRAYALVPAASLACALPLYMGFVWAPSWQIALVFLVGPTFLNYFYLSSSVTLVQESVRPDQRVTSGALLLLIMNLIGMGIGPTLVGEISDFVHRGNPHHSLQFAFYALLPFYALAIGLFLWLAQVLKSLQSTAEASS